MRLIIKVLAQEDPLPGTTYASLVNQFEACIPGDNARFLDLVNKIIGIIPTTVLLDEPIIDPKTPGSIT